ncbi:MAG TPA: ABC transporter permease, partial [Flavisolibacter sp.]|nr:ABC transporter permease [Flavisolibacter sp.]
MNKSLLIIKREYLTRVRKKTFIISTILFPLLYLLLIFGTGYIAKKTSKQLRVAVIDSSGLFDKRVVAESNLRDSSSYLEYVTASPETVKEHFSSMGFDGYVIVPVTDWKSEEHKVALKTDKTHGIQSVLGVQNKLNSIWNTVKYQKLGIDEET